MENKMNVRRALNDNTGCLLPHFHNDPKMVLDPDLAKLEKVYRASILVNLWLTAPLDFEKMKEKDEYDVILPEDQDMASFLKRQVNYVDQVLGKIKRPNTVELSPRIELFYHTIKKGLKVNPRLNKKGIDHILREFHGGCQGPKSNRAMNVKAVQIARRIQSVDSVFHKRKCKPQDNADFFSLAYPKGELPCKFSLMEGAKILRHAFSGYRRGVDPKKMGFSDFPGRVFMQYHFTPAFGAHWSIGFCGLPKEEMDSLKALMLELWLDVYPKGVLLTPHLKDRSVADAKKYLALCMQHKRLITPSLPVKTHSIIRSM
jgi:hypothetical protein